MLYFALLCYAIYYAMQWYAMLCYAMLCYAMLCYTMICYAMLAMFCYVMLSPESNESLRIFLRFRIRFWWCSIKYLVVLFADHGALIGPCFKLGDIFLNLLVKDLQKVLFSISRIHGRKAVSTHLLLACCPWAQILQVQSSHWPREKTLVWWLLLSLHSSIIHTFREACPFCM